MHELYKMPQARYQEQLEKEVCKLRGLLETTAHELEFVVASLDENMPAPAREAAVRALANVRQALIRDSVSR